MTEKPTFTRWKRKTGGMKVCPQCKHRHQPLMRIDGKPTRVKTCVRCGADLPRKLSYPKKSSVKWFVREFNPTTGKTNDHPCESSEAAEELIRRKHRDFTPCPIQEKLTEYAGALIRQVNAESLDDGINQLIVKLGGDATAGTLKPIGWNEARDIVCRELRDKGLSTVYVDNMSRVIDDLRAIVGLESWTQLDLDGIALYRSTRLAGGWKRDGRTVRAVGGEAVNSDLRALRAFLTRAVRKGWVAENVLKGASDEQVKVKRRPVAYMPDEDLRTLIESASEAWLRTFIVVAYYTGARRADLLALEWDHDVDLTGSKVATNGCTGGYLFIRGNKAETPRWTPLHPAAVAALEGLRHEPVVDHRVFPVRGSRSRHTYVSASFAQLCVQTGLTVERNGKAKNKWTLHHLRKKANTDLRNRGASRKERAALLGHRSEGVNESFYEALLPERERALIDALPAFGMTA